MKEIPITLAGEASPITGVLEGSSNGLPCLVLGPASIYIPTIPKALKEKYLFYGADYYWNKNCTVSTETIQSLTFEQMARDGERIRKAFEDQYPQVAQTLVLGPSALGWLAMKQAELYPNTILGIIGLNTPLVDLETLSKEENYFIRPYDPSLFPEFKTLETDESSRLWKEHQNFASEYERQKKLGFASDTDDYIAELKREKIRYMENDELFTNMLKLWEPFNITTRQRFFEEAGKINPGMFKGITCPVWLPLGARDGIVPPYTTSEDAICKFPKNFTYYIFDSKHMPQFEVQENFTLQFNEWISDNNFVKSNPNNIGCK
jgi:pimeloyl-ACP methyl ester carboxylesterase